MSLDDFIRVDLGYGDSRLDKKTFPLWYYGIVERVDDTFYAGRIKVRIEGVDRKILLPAGGKTKIENKELGNEDSDAYLPWCEPLLPKFLNIVPQVGEMVKVAVFDYRNKQQRRQYIGPVIGQKTPADFQYNDYNIATLQTENSAYSPAYDNWPESSQGNWSIYPNVSDVALLGRRNTDLILRNKSNYDEIILRSGKIDYRNLNTNSPPISLNIKNPAYITINHTFPTENKTETQTNLGLGNDRTHINLVADKLNLISHMGSSAKGKAPVILNGDDVLQQIITENTKLHPLIYGDVLWEFMSILRSYIEGHIHEGSKLPSDKSGPTLELIKWFNKNLGNRVSKPSTDLTVENSYVDFEGCTFLSKGVRTN